MVSCPASILIPLAKRDLTNIERPASHGSTLGRVVCAAVTQPVDLSEVEGFEPLALYENFTPPRYSTSFLRAASQRLCEDQVTKAQRAIDLTLARLNRDRAFSLWRINEPFTDIPRSSVSSQRTKDVRGGCAFPTAEPDYLLRAEPKATPYDSAWDALRLKTYQSRFGEMPLRGNWCPTCKEYVATAHDGPQGISCEKYIAKRDENAKQHTAKRAKTLEDYYAEWTAKRIRKQLEARRLRERFVYSSDEFDRDILVSRGSVTAEAVRQGEPYVSSNLYRT